MSHQSLLREVLSARVGLSRHYDGINRSMTASDDAIRELAVLSTDRADLAAATQALADGAWARHAAVERFKSDNALLQNALARFALLSNTPADAGADLPAFILRLTLDTSPDVTRAARDELQRFGPTGPAAAAATAQAGLLIFLLPRVDDILRALDEPGVEANVERVRQSISQADRESSAVRKKLAFSLSASVLACFICGGTLSLLAYERHRRLRWQGANEHLRATVAELLLAPGEGDADARIVRVLKHLAGHRDVTRALVARPDRSPMHILAWPVLQDDQGQRIKARIEGADAMPGWSGNVLALPTGEDAESEIILLRDGKRGGVMLGIEADPELRERRPELFAGLGMALVAIGQAIEREAADAGRIALERRLADAERLEAIGTIASGLAHNFNNILGAIGGFGEMAQARARRGSAIAGYLDEIGSAVERARALIDDILGFARRRSVPSRRVRLAALLEETVALLRAAHPGEGRIVVDADRAEEVVGDAARLQQVFMNLCNNARAASPENAQITMIASERAAAHVAYLSHGTLEAGNYVVVAVSDKGAGVPRTIMPRLFEPFFTTRPGGTGLGLSTAWQIVRDHGGTINVVMLPEGGSCFEVWLPRALAMELVDGRWFGSGERILLLTEEERAADVETMLADLGCEPVFLSFAALRRASSNAETLLTEVDAVLAIDPPALALAWLRRKGSAPPLIVAAAGNGAEQGTPSAQLQLPLQENALAAALGAVLSHRPA
ncbi:ATP-binding protein [Roseomonas sp. WA12]